MYSLTVLNDRPAGTRKVNIDVLAFVHSELSTSDDNSAFLGIGDVRCTFDITTN